jgi:hypothetical protein
MPKFDSLIKSLFGTFIESQQILRPGSEMARPKTSSKKLSVTLPMDALATLDQLVARKFYGESRSEIARFLLIKALDTVEERRLKEPSAD